jgi:hypothetical protein
LRTGFPITAGQAQPFNRYKALVSLAYRQGIRNKKVTVNPARLVPQRKEPKGRLRFLSREEFDKLRNVIETRFHEEPARVLLCITRLWHSIFLSCACFVGLKFKPSPPKQALSRGGLSGVGAFLGSHWLVMIGRGETHEFRVWNEDLLAKPTSTELLLAN